MSARAVSGGLTLNRAVVDGQKVRAAEEAIPREEISPALRLQLQTERVDVHADRAWTDSEILGDLAVCMAASYQPEDLKLTGGEMRCDLLGHLLLLTTTWPQTDD